MIIGVIKTISFMITSSQNPKIQQVRGLLQRRKERKKSGLFAAEGVRLVEEGLKAGWKPLLTFFSENISERGLNIISRLESEGDFVEEISQTLMDDLSDTETAQGILSVFSSESTGFPQTADFLLILDNLRDPGNLGTILRSAAAAGVQGIILTPGTTDAFAPKVVRAGMGAHFYIPIRNMDWDEISRFTKDTCNPPLKLFASNVYEGKCLWEENLRQPCALIIGSEAEGVSSETLQITDSSIHIPMPGKSESLNAATAASILIFEVIRQRSL